MSHLASVSLETGAFYAFRGKKRHRILLSRATRFGCSDCAKQNSYSTVELSEDGMGVFQFRRNRNEKEGEPIQIKL